MLVTMAKVQVLGRKRDLEHALELLHGLCLVELDQAGDPALRPEAIAAAEARERRRNETRYLIARVDGLLGLAAAADGGTPSAADLRALETELDAVAPRVEELTGRLEELRTEQVVLQRHVVLLRRLLGLVPELDLLDERELVALRLATVTLVLGAADERIVDLLREELASLLGPRFWLVSAPVDDEATGCVLLHPRESREAVQALLGQERIRHVPLPGAYARLSLRSSAEAMERRLAELPGELAAAEVELAATLAPYVPGWRAARGALAARLEQLDAVALSDETERLFVLVGWTPRAEVARLRSALEQELDGRVAVEELRGGARDVSAPVLMRSRAPARAFQPLVRFFDTPRARSIDPTGLMALFLPLMFGLMVADIAYGALLLAGAFAVRRRFAPSPVLRDISRVMIAGSLWAIVFGVVFGEALGNLGENAGLPALWVYRDSKEAIVPLLLLALAIGAAHVVLGLLLGLWESVRDRNRNGVADHAGMLLSLAGVFALAAVAAERLPAAAVTPAAAAIVVGLVAVSAVQGVLGLLLGPLELVGTVTNVLSYIRLAAVGLASVYLAVVANELAVAGPLWLGIVVAAFLHALNLALAGFTPVVQALRLHYVEFFGKFFIGGGRPFRPFGTPPEGAARGAAPVNP